MWLLFSVETLAGICLLGSYIALVVLTVGSIVEWNIAIAALDFCSHITVLLCFSNFLPV